MSPAQRSYWRSKDISQRARAHIPVGASWGELSDDEQIAYRVLDRHIMFRLHRRNRRFRAFEDGGTIFTTKHITRPLRELRYPRRGLHFARHLRRILITNGALKETDENILPTRQPDTHPVKTYYWRVYVITSVAELLRDHAPRGTYDSGRVPSVPQQRLSLSSELKSQGVIQKIRSASEFNRGSPQWVFAMSGPP